MLDGVGTFLVLGLIAMAICILGLVYTGIDFFFLEDSIKSSTIIAPEIKLIIKDNKVDTIYIYRNK